jgi:hypothetical protein
MSNFRAMTKATDTALAKGVDESFKDWQPAEWLDNYWGGHKYGIKFDNDPTVRADNGDFIYSTDMPIEVATTDKKGSDA